MSKSKFTSFVILGAMRTGSNFLERSLTQHPAVTGFGELFNPEFFGKKNHETALGFTLAEREADPLRILREMRRSSDGLAGFRLFEGHDTRVKTAVLEDPTCAKIILERAPLDSFLSLKIAQQTDQWLLRNNKSRKSAKIAFDVADFEIYRARSIAYYEALHTELQILGQTAFQIAFSQLGDIRVLNGLLRYLGVDGEIAGPDTSLLRQNPERAEDKVSNPEALTPYLNAPPNTAIPRTPQIKRLITSGEVPLLFAPIAGGPTSAVCEWLGAFEDRHNQKSLKAWLDAQPGYSSFSVVSDPLMRAYRVFATKIVAEGAGTFPKIRRRLERFHGIEMPKDKNPEAWSTSFLGFLQFLEKNLAGQTGIRIDDIWAPQCDLLAAISAHQPVMHLIKEADLSARLSKLCPNTRRVYQAAPLSAPPFEKITTPQIERQCRKTYRQDYRKFGFE